MKLFFSDCFAYENCFTKILKQIYLSGIKLDDILEIASTVWPPSTVLIPSLAPPRCFSAHPQPILSPSSSFLSLLSKKKFYYYEMKWHLTKCKLNKLVKVKYPVVGCCSTFQSNGIFKIDRRNFLELFYPTING